MFVCTRMHWPEQEIKSWTRNKLFGYKYLLETTINVIGVIIVPNRWLNTDDASRRRNHNIHLIQGKLYILGGRFNQDVLNIQSLAVSDDLEYSIVPQLCIPGRIEFFTSIVWNV